jgi:hypothetical protein
MWQIFRYIQTVLNDIAKATGITYTDTNIILFCFIGPVLLFLLIFLSLNNPNEYLKELLIVISAADFLAIAIHSLVYGLPNRYHFIALTIVTAVLLIIISKRKKLSIYLSVLVPFYFFVYYYS